MKSSLYLIVFVLAVATAYAVSQSQPPAAPANGAPSAQSGTSTTSPQPATKGDEDTARPSAAQQEKTPDAEKAPATSGSSDDASLQTQVQQQLATQNFNNVTVSVSNGVVTLTGSVPSKADRKRVKELAKNVAGVRRVSEKLEVNPKAASAAAPASTPNTAGSIAGNAEAAGGTQAPTSPTMAGTTSANGTTASQSTPSASSTASTQSTTSASTQTAPGASAGVSGTTGGVTGSASTTTGTSTAQPGTTGAVAGSAGTTAGTTAAGTTTATTTAEDSQLQTQIDGALKNEPTLSGANVSANVTADTIELSGSVPTGKEKQTARRIAQSFAGNRRLVDRLTVTGNGANNPSTINPPDNSQNPKGDATSPKR